MSAAVASSVRSGPQYDWAWFDFDTLPATVLYDVLAARAAVFVVEQRCAYQDVDGADRRARHLVASCRGELAAYCRTFAPGIKYAEASIGRVLTTEGFRGTGIGRELVARALAGLDAECDTPAIRISAQAHLERFYAAFGFVTVSAPYMEDDIPHVQMLRAGRGA